MSVDYVPFIVETLFTTPMSRVAGRPFYDCGTAAGGGPYTSPTPPCSNYYTVKAGDTCYDSIWIPNGLSESQFYSLNPGINCNNLQAGQQVCIGGSSSPCHILRKLSKLRNFSVRHCDQIPATQLLPPVENLYL